MEILTLKKRKDFVRVAQKGLKMVTSTVILQAALNLSAEDGNIYVGYTTTKKIGKAHIRNRTRRRLRAAVREVIAQNSLPGTTYVLIGRYNTADCNFKRLTKDLSWGLRKLTKLFNGEGADHDEPVAKAADSAD